jgi:hypothetical protein
MFIVLHIDAVRRSVLYWQHHMYSATVCTLITAQRSCYASTVVQLHEACRQYLNYRHAHHDHLYC